MSDFQVNGYKPISGGGKTQATGGGGSNTQQIPSSTQRTSPAFTLKQNVADVQKSDVRNRQNKKTVATLIDSISTLHKQQLLQQLKRQLKQKFFSDIAIKKQMQAVAFKLFFYPSQSLANLIQKKFGVQSDAIIRNSVTLRHGDLYFIQSNVNNEQKQEIDHIMTQLIPWGMYLLDLKKLQQLSSNKLGNSTDRKYIIDDMQIEVQIKQTISLKYKNRLISPSQMKNSVLKQMALQRLRKRAVTILYEVTKNQQIII